MNDSCQHFLRPRVSCKSIQAPMIKTCIPIGGSRIIDQQSKSSSNQVFRDEIQHTDLEHLENIQKIA